MLPIKPKKRVILQTLFKGTRPVELEERKIPRKPFMKTGSTPNALKKKTSPRPTSKKKKKIVPRKSSKVASSESQLVLAGGSVAARKKAAKLGGGKIRDASGSAGMPGEEDRDPPTY